AAVSQSLHVRLVARTLLRRPLRSRLSILFLLKDFIWLLPRRSRVLRLAWCIALRAGTLSSSGDLNLVIHKGAAAKLAKTQFLGRERPRLLQFRKPARRAQKPSTSKPTSICSTGRAEREEGRTDEGHNSARDCANWGQLSNTLRF